MSEKKGKIEPKAQCVGLRELKRPLAWAAVTLVAAGIARVAVSPRACEGVAGCQTIHRDVPNNLNTYAFCGLITVFLHEVASLHLNFRSAQPLVGLIYGIQEVFLPSLLLCVTFAVLVAENAYFMSGNDMLTHSTAYGDTGRPVYTIIYLEWLVNVPILLVLAGKCALNRPLAEVTNPVVMTNIYIILSWAAHFIENAAVRRSVVALSFAMYGWCSYEMVLWVVEFRRTAPPGVPSRALRPLLSVGLIFIFGVYGIVYLAALADVISSFEERAYYVCMDIGVKLIMSMAFAGIRSGAYHDMLIDMLVNANLPFQRQIACKDGVLDENEEDLDLTEPLLKTVASARQAGAAGPIRPLPRVVH